MQLTLGSKYRILSLGSREEMIETKGTFKGVVSIGTIDAMAIELSSFHKEWAGKLRVLPSHMVLAIDIEEAAPGPEESTAEANIHYT